jgi:hypothetical protein
LHGKVGSGTHSHSGEAGFRLWWIQGAIFATLTAVGIAKITTEGQKGPSNGVLMVEHFILLPSVFCFLLLLFFF